VSTPTVFTCQGADNDGFLSGEIVLILAGLVLLVVVMQAGIGSIGEWLGNLITGGFSGL
jgi:hypothetical protein